MEEWIQKDFSQQYESIKSFSKLSQLLEYVRLLIEVDELSPRIKLKKYRRAMEKVKAEVVRQKKYKSVVVVKTRNVDWSGFYDDPECDGPDDDSSILREEDFHQQWEDRGWREVEL